MMRTVILVVCAASLTSCAVTFEDARGNLHRMGFFWEKTTGAQQADVQIKNVKTVGLGVDTTDLTGGFVLGYKDWTVVALSGDAEIDLCLP